MGDRFIGQAQEQREPSVIRFADITFSPATSELWRASEEEPKVLRPQLSRLLELFLEQPGQLLGRTRIHEALWGETVVDVDRGLNFCIRQLREILGDDARDPRFIETLPRQGYRFIGQPERTGPGRGTEVVGNGGSLTLDIAALDIAAVDGAAVDVAAVDGAARMADPGDSEAESGDPDSTHGVAANQGWFRPRHRAAWLLLPCLLVLVGWWLRDWVDGSGSREQGSLPGPEMPADAHEATAVREALEIGRHLMLQGLPSIDRAEDVLMRAVVLEPEAADAWADLAMVYIARSERDPSRLDMAASAIDRALEIDPDLAAAHIRRALLMISTDRDWQGAEKALRHALALDPGQIEARYRLACLLSTLGRDAEALALAEEARRIDPMTMAQLGNAAHLWIYAGRFDEANAVAHRVLEVLPNSKCALLVRLYALERLGLIQEASEYAVRLARLDGDPEPIVPTTEASLHAYWLRRLELLEDLGGSGARISRAAIHAHLGNRVGALDELEAVARSGSWILPFLLRDPRFEPLYAEPRFEALLVGTGLGGMKWADGDAKWGDISEI